MKFYVASRTRHAAIWRSYRAAGVPIIATWIDEAGPGESKDLADLAARCVKEASEADVTVLYCEEVDRLKGALIEVGAALAFGREVRSVGYCPSLATALAHHPRWQLCGSLDLAFGIGRPLTPSAPAGPNPRPAP